MSPAKLFAVLAALAVALFASGGSASAFDVDTAFEYLYYSYAAYCPQDELETWTCKWCQEPSVSSFVPYSFPYNTKTDGFGYVGYNPANETIVVSFRGTVETSLRNWIVDLENIFLEPYRNYTDIYVGDGWQDEWDGLEDEVMSAVSNLHNLYPSYEIWVTGHSLGAAMSIMCAAELAQEGYSNVKVYNYGLPRVGDVNFSSFYTSLVPDTYRLVNGHDIVPHLPLEAMGFHHVPTEVWENPAEGMDFTVCDGSGEDPNCSDSQTLDLSVYDHLHYLNVYEDCADGPDMSGEPMKHDAELRRVARTVQLRDGQGLR